MAALFKGRNFARLLEGLGVTIEIAAVSIALSIVLGVGLGLLMTVKNRAVRAFCRLWLETIRIMPQLVLLFLAYFGLARAFDIQLSGFAASVIVFTFWGTGEMGDLVRGALESIPAHQRESGAGAHADTGISIHPAAADGAAADSAGDQSVHAHDQDHAAGDADRRGRNAEGERPDHRRLAL